MFVLICTLLLAHGLSYGSQGHNMLLNDPDWINTLRHFCSNKTDWTEMCRKKYSQGNQDYILDVIFSHIGSTNKHFVEFGFNERDYFVGSGFNKTVLGSGANTAKMYEDGWRGLLLDAENENLEINLRKHYIFQNNILSIFKQYSVPIEMDYLSVDMDSHDLFILKSILNGGYKPRVISTEYNSNYPLNLSVTQIDPTILNTEEANGYVFKFKGCIWGASPSAWHRLLKNDYVLVAKVTYLDLFWIRKDIVDTQKILVPRFESFFSGLHGKPERGYKYAHHKSLDDVADLNHILDYDDYAQKGNVEAARAKAIINLKKYASRRPCFKILFQQ